MTRARLPKSEGQGTEGKGIDSFGTFLEAVQGEKAAKASSIDTERELELVRSGSDALTELIRKPEVSRAVISFRMAYEPVSKNIGLLVDYKSLHDLLHRLEIYCYYPLIQDIRRPIDDPRAQDNLVNCEMILWGIIDELYNLVSEAAPLANEETWIQTLDQALEQIHAGIERSDARRRDRAARFINRVLAIQPARINAYLNAAARSMQLPALVNALVVLRGELFHVGFDSERLVEFERTINSIAKVAETFDSTISEHNRWQEIDTELRGFQRVLDPDPQELKWSWKNLKERMSQLLGSSQEPWAIHLSRETDHLEKAVESEDSENIASSFYRYRFLASQRFYQVDRALLKLCEDLRKSTERLDSSLAMRT